MINNRQEKHTELSAQLTTLSEPSINRMMSVPTITIEASRGWSMLGLRDLREYRELIYYWVLREIQGLYRQTALGFSWIFIKPLINVVLLSVIFGGMVKIPSDNIPYPLFSLSALVPWGYFSTAVARASRSLVDNTHIISKVYFPRMVLPISACLSGLIEMAASLLVLFLAIVYYRIPLRVEMVWLPAIILVTVVFALTGGLWLASLSVIYRDVSFAVNVLLQAMMYISPVIYSVSVVPEPLQFLYQLNPMTGVIQGFRWAIFGTSEVPGLTFVISIIILLLALVSGAFIFRRTERTIVDVI